MKSLFGMLLLSARPLFQKKLSNRKCHMGSKHENPLDLCVGPFHQLTNALQIFFWIFPKKRFSGSVVAKTWIVCEAVFPKIRLQCLKNDFRHGNLVVLGECTDAILHARCTTERCGFRHQMKRYVHVFLRNVFPAPLITFECVHITI
jgi:hypothetical protein